MGVISRCFFGAPDSPMVNIVGRGIKNFVDTTDREREEVRLEGDYLILYQQKDYSEDDKGHLKDKSYLYLKYTKDNKVTKILEGDLGYEIRYGVIIPEKNLIVFSFRKGRVDPSGRRVLKVYDYLNNIFTDEKEITSGWVNHHGPILYDLIISKDKQYICGDIFESTGMIWTKYKHFSKCFKLDKNVLTPTAQISYEEIKREQREMDVQTREECITKDGDELMVFRVSQESDFLPANYKSKYNGLYIHSKKENVNRRISLRNDFYIDQILWIDNGSKLIRGGYLYDTTGEKKESLLVDGNIIYIVKIE